MIVKEKISAIIDSVSNWIKLLALIVLIGEIILLVAMNQTSVESSVYPMYPFAMIFLLVLLIILIFWDRQLKRKSKIQSKKLSLQVDDKELTVDSNKTLSEKLNETKERFTNGLLGYSFDLPNTEGWSDPQEITYSNYVRQIYLSEEMDEEYFKKVIATNSPYGNLYYHAKIITLQHGETLVIEFDDTSTTDAAEYQIKEFIELKKLEGVELTETEINDMRKKINQTDSVSKIGFAIKLDVITFEKDKLKVNFINTGLPNLFLSLSAGSGEPIDSLVSNDDLILWKTSNKLKNVTVGDELFSSFYIYRLYQLVQTPNYIYLSTVQWSPQLESAVFTWDSLKKMFESFRVKK